MGMNVKNIALTAILVGLNVFGIMGIVLQEIGALYIWFQGKCYIGAYYQGSSAEELVEGVEVKIIDFWGNTKSVVTSKRLVYVTLYFRGWYRIEASYNGSVMTKTITTASPRYLYVGIIYIILDPESETILDILYVSPPRY